MTSTSAAVERRPRAGVRASLAISGLAAVPAAAGLVLWGLSFRSIDLSKMNGLGLLPALPWTTYAALVVIGVGFLAALQRDRLPEVALGAHVVALILVIHGTPTIAYGTLRYGWAWKHVGIVDYILRNGRVDPSITALSAYHNWPGFFALASLYTHVAGFANAIGLATWGPVYFNLAFAAALVPLFGTLTADRRRVWLAVWFFVCANWIGQDYFSPQAFGYFLFLVVLTVCLGWFRANGTRLAARVLGPGELGGLSYRDTGTAERAALAALVVLLAAVIAVSHQLTPMMLILALAGLVLVDRLALRALPPLVAVLTFGWAALFATGFLRGNLYWIADSVGTLTSNSGATLISLGKASSSQQLIARVDRALTSGVWLLGALGFARLALARRLELTTAVLALAPFVMVAFTSYGGEILFRVFLFALPFFALLGTGLFFPTGARGTWRTVTAAAAVSAALLAGLLVAYYGKDKQTYFPPSEVQAVDAVYRMAPPGSLLVTVVNSVPWAFSHYEDYSYLQLGDLNTKDRRLTIRDPEGMVRAAAQIDRAKCAFVVVSESQEATVTATGVLPRGSLPIIERNLGRAKGYRLVLRTPTTVVYGTPLSAPPARCGLR